MVSGPTILVEAKVIMGGKLSSSINATGRSRIEEPRLLLKMTSYEVLKKNILVG